MVRGWTPRQFGIWKAHSLMSFNQIALGNVLTEYLGGATVADGFRICGGPRMWFYGYLDPENERLEKGIRVYRPLSPNP